jgi:hypothetical protein
LARTPLTFAFERKIETIGVINMIEHQFAATADSASADGVLGISGDLHRPAVFHFQSKTTARMTQAAIRSSGFCHIRRLLSDFCTLIAEAAKRLLTSPIAKI